MRLLIILVLSCLGVILGYSNTPVDSSVIDLNDIPDEIFNRIPEGEVALFINARKRVIDKLDKRSLSGAYEEIGVSRAMLERIPSGDLMQFLSDRGYVELLPNEHAHFSEHNGPPPPEELMTLLYVLLIGIILLIALSLFLGHLRKKKELEIIVKALDNQEEIPYRMLAGNRARTFMTYCVVLCMIGLSIYLMAWSQIVPRGLMWIPFSLALGYGFLWYFERRSI